MNVFRTATKLAVVLALLGVAAPAAAQTDEEVAAAWTMLSTTSTSGVLTTVGGVVLTVYLLNKDGKKAMKTYIRDNAVALRHDITRGGGATMADLGQVFGVPEEQLGLFGRAVRAERDALLGLVGPTPIDDAKTERFIETLWKAVASNEELARAVAATQG